MAAHVPKCARCGQPLALGPTGRPRRYCSQTCRQLAYAARKRALPYLPHVPPPATDENVPHLVGSDEEVARAILEARSIASAVSRLSHMARPEFAWRLELVAHVLTSALDEYFGGV